VPPNTPIVTTVPAERSSLKPGKCVFVAARVDADGKMTALRIQASKDGSNLRGKSASVEVPAR